MTPRRIEAGYLPGLDPAEVRWQILPFGEGEVRVELDPRDYAALTREMVRFWNEQGEAASQPPAPLKEDEA